MVTRDCGPVGIAARLGIGMVTLDWGPVGRTAPAIYRGVALIPCAGLWRATGDWDHPPCPSMIAHDWKSGTGEVSCLQIRTAQRSLPEHNQPSPFAKMRKCKRPTWSACQPTPEADPARAAPDGPSRSTG